MAFKYSNVPIKLAVIRARVGVAPHSCVPPYIPDQELGDWIGDWIGDQKAPLAPQASLGGLLGLVEDRRLGGAPEVSIDALQREIWPLLEGSNDGDELDSWACFLHDVRYGLVPTGTFGIDKFGISRARLFYVEDLMGRTKNGGKPPVRRARYFCWLEPGEEDKRLVVDVNRGSFLRDTADRLRNYAVNRNQNMSERAQLAVPRAPSWLPPVVP